MNRFPAVLLLMIPVILFAQPAPDTLWTRTFGGAGDDVPAAIRQTGDGGYIIAGYTTSFGAGGQDAYLLKLDADGNMQWQRTYGLSSNDSLADVKQTNDGGFIAIGTILAGTDHEPQIWLLRLDSLGDTLWTRNYRLFLRQYGRGVVEVEDSSFFITAKADSFAGTGHYKWGIYAHIQLSGGMDSIWTVLGVDQGDFAGSYVYFPDVELAAHHGIFVSKFDHFWYHYSPGHLYIIDRWALYHRSFNGSLIWSVTGPENEGLGGALAPLADGGCLIQILHFGVKRIDSAGQETWSRAFSDAFVDLRSTPREDGAVLLSTVVGGNDNVRLAGYDTMGTLLWQGTWGGAGDDQAVALEATSDSGYVIVGTTTSFGAGGMDIYVIKTDPHHWLNADQSRTALPSSIALSAFPNPFNPSTTLSFSLPKTERAKLALYNVEGRLVRVPTDEVMQAGEHRVAFDGAALPSGIYFARVTAGEMAATKKIMLLK